MEESYCIKDKRITPCVSPKGKGKDKRGRDIIYSKCGECGTRKVRYILLSPIIVENDDEYESIEHEYEIDYNYIRRL